MLDELRTIWLGHRERIIVAYNRIVLVYDEVRPVDSTPYWTPPTAKQFAAAEINLMIAGNVIVPAAKEWVAPVVLFCKEDGLPCFCIDYRTLSTVLIRDRYPSFAWSIESTALETKSCSVHWTLATSSRAAKGASTIGIPNHWRPAVTFMGLSGCHSGRQLPGQPYIGQWR